MEYAYKERAIPLLNWDLIEYPKELGVKKVVSLSKDQEQALIQCIYMNLNRKTAGILIALFTGVRIGELCGLQMKDISLTDKTISINKTVQRIYDKKKGESYLHIGPPKTKTSARTIPVPSLLMNIIKKFYTENPNHYFLTGKTKPTEPRTYRQFFSRFLKRNGLQKVKFHEIRHTFAVRAIEIPEFDIKSLSEILGHKNVSFTLNVYGSANLQQKVKCMNLLLEDALKQFSELREQAKNVDSAKLSEQRIALQGEKIQSATSKIKETYGEKFDPLILFDSKRDVSELLGEKTEVQSVREHLQKKQKQTAERKKTSKKHEQER